MSATPCPVDGRCGKPCPSQPACRAVAEASRAAGVPDGHVWLGDLAGFEVVPVLTDDAYGEMALELRHRCGWSRRLPFEGITGDAGAYLANTVEAAVLERRGHVCRGKHG